MPLPIERLAALPLPAEETRPRGVVVTDPHDPAEVGRYGGWCGGGIMRATRVGNGGQPERSNRWSAAALVLLVLVAPVVYELLGRG